MVLRCAESFLWERDESRSKCSAIGASRQSENLSVDEGAEFPSQHAGSGGQQRRVASAALLSRFSRSTPGLQDLPCKNGEEGLRAFPMDFVRSSSEVLQRKMQQIVDDELFQDRVRQLEDLAAKAAALERDCQKGREDVRVTERQYKSLAEDAQRQLAEARVEIETLQREVTNLMERLKEHRFRQTRGVERQEEELAARIAKTESEADRLVEFRQMEEAAVEAAHLEIADLRARLDVLFVERSRAQEEALSVTASAQAWRKSLQEGKKRLEDSEQRRAVLRDRYLQAGQHFEDLISRSQQDGQKVIIELQEEYRRCQQKMDKHKQRFETLEAEVHGLEATVEAEQASLNDKAGDIQRLQKAIEVEQAALSQQEMRHAQCVVAAKGAIDGRLDANELIPVSVHQQLLEEQTRHFQEASALGRGAAAAFPRTPAPAVVGRRPRQRSASTERMLGEHSNASCYKDRPRRTVPRARWALQQAAHDDEVRQSAAKVRALEDNLEELRQSHKCLQANLVRLDAQRGTLAGSLREANGHLLRLQRIVVEEEEAEANLQDSTFTAEGEIAAIKGELNAKAALLQQRLHFVVETSESAAESIDSIEVVKDAVDRRRQECQAEGITLHTLHTQYRNYLTKLEEAHLRRTSLEEQCVDHESKNLKLCTTLKSIKQMVRQHAFEARVRLEQLRCETTLELRDVKDHCQERVQQWQVSLQEQRRQMYAQEKWMSRSGEEARSRYEELQVQAKEASVEVEEVKQQLHEMRGEVALHEARLVGLQAIVAAQRRGVEHILSTAMAAVTATREFDPIKTITLGDAGLVLATRLPAVLDDLRDGLGTALREARASGATITRAQAEQCFETGLQLQRVAAAAGRSELEAELASAESRRDVLALELRNRQAVCHTEALAHAKLHERRSEVSVEVTAQRQRLSIARQQASDYEQEILDLSRQLDSLRIEGSLSVELSRGDAAQPLRAQLYDILAGVDELQSRFQHEIRDVESSWAKRCASFDATHEQVMQTSRQNSAVEVEVMRQEMVTLRNAEIVALDSAELCIGEVAQELAQRRMDLEERASICMELREGAEAWAIEESTSQAAMKKAEATLEHAHEARRREQHEIDERRTAVIRQQEEEMDELRRQKETEVSNLQSRWQQSITGLSVVTLDAEDADVSSVLDLDASGNGLGKSQLAERSALTTRKNLSFSPTR